MIEIHKLLTRQVGTLGSVFIDAKTHEICVTKIRDIRNGVLFR